MTRFSGKVALITGSSTGIGKATAILFAKEGAKVTVTGRNTQRFEETKQEILNAGIPEDHILAIATNLATEEGQDELINETIKKFGRLDILVNNAMLELLTMLELFSMMLREKMGLLKIYRSVVTLTQKALKFLIEAKGEIVNVSSMAAGPQAQPSVTYYAMSKTALDQFTRSIAIDLIQHGVRVNSVSPGVVKTSFGLIEGMLQDKYKTTAILEPKFANIEICHKHRGNVKNNTEKINVSLQSSLFR
ncbi:Protein CBG12121 [Caenorhabditis briggsae]|uniref:Protein CBG12121 n=1 Tax=Caenorhabditis briggsae TaxID=6238 RepID=A8XET0_CAEBR|nr:Protein CBG12121 [Caenorhabditis briggsae]CAP31152.1 Protein CBG12121 [Caenorhabditis briggsae]